MERITALIPTYRRPHFLRRAILSVLQQTYTNLQVNVFDNASEDITEQVVSSLKEMDNRVFYCAHPSNIGALRNFAYAFQSVNTPYFSILSDDDALAPEFYERAINILEKHRDLMFVVLNTLSINEHADLTANQENTSQLTFYYGENRLQLFNAHFTWTSILFRKEVAKLYVEMDNRFDIASDMRFLLLAISRYDFAHLSEVGAFFTQQTHSISFSRKRFDMMHHVVQISRYLEVFYHAEISQPFKEAAMISIKKMLKSNRRESFITFIETLKLAIKRVCDDEHSDNLKLIEEIRDAKLAGFNVSAFFLKLIYQNKIIKSIISILFSKYYLRLKERHQKEMLALQHGIYKNVFEKLKLISE